MVAPDSPRLLIGQEALHGPNKILATASFHSSSHEVFFDQGILASAGAGQREAETTCNGHPCSFHFEQDSRKILGLQVADLIAHTCATMLLAQLGLVRKTVKAGPNSGYDPDADMPLEFELWAGLRYNFFATGPPPYDTWKSSLISKWMWNQKSFTFQAVVKSSSRTQLYQDLAACILDAYTSDAGRETLGRT